MLWRLIYVGERQLRANQNSRQTLWIQFFWGASCKKSFFSVYCNNHNSTPMIDLRSKLQASFEEIRSDLKDSIVFVDEEASYSLQWNISLESLFQSFQVANLFQLVDGETNRYQLCHPYIRRNTDSIETVDCSRANKQAFFSFSLLFAFVCLFPAKQ